MENQTFSGDILILEGLKVTSQTFLSSFILLLIIYIFIMVSNIGLVVLIFMNRNLHQPMYLLLCNMSINDVFGATIIVPHVLKDLLMTNSERYINYIDCAVQAFLAAWGTAFVLVAILIGLSVRLSRCRSVILNLFCDNASLFKLSCESVLINNIYGLGYTVVLLGSSMGSVTLTYLRIAAVCVLSKNKAVNSKALQTCATHLAVYIILLVSGFVIVILHRFPQLSYNRKVAAVMGHVVLPALNALIYGLQIKEVRQRILALFRSNKVALMERK
uniref:G-protein coupled receptors family 1 profile domain-containing protein n=1 Tax=Dicentrarchus labrax TaxID=13489 RepID=A0A8C4DN67_DICLA